MSSLDRTILWLGTLLMLAVVIAGAASTAGGADHEDDALGALRPLLPLDGAADASSDASRLPPTGALPAGASIDPETLELVGIDLQPEDGSTVVAWDLLRSYEYEEGLVGVPEAIQALDGRPVTMAGFLLPLYEFDDIREFNLVASHWSCCFGVPPGINGWIYIRLKRGHAGLKNSTEPLKVTGTFRVREQKEAGYIVSIYSLEDAKATVLGW